MVLSKLSLSGAGRFRGPRGATRSGWGGGDIGESVGSWRALKFLFLRREAAVVASSVIVEEDKVPLGVGVETKETSETRCSGCAIRSARVDNTDHGVNLPTRLGVGCALLPSL